MSSTSPTSTDSGADSIERLSTEQLARENMPLAMFLATEKARSAAHVNLDDLISAAGLGLTRAVQAFEPERGIPFGAFARNHINWAIASEMRQADPAGERSRSRIARVLLAAETLQQRLGRKATTAELSRESGLDENVVEEMLALDAKVRTSTSLDGLDEKVAGFIGADFHSSPDVLQLQMTDVVTGTRLVDKVILPDHAVENAEQHEMLCKVIAALPDTMRQIIRGIYVEDRMVKDIAADLEVSSAYISKQRSAALGLMREAMDAWETGKEVDRSTKTRALFFEGVFGDSRTRVLSAVA